MDWLKDYMLHLCTAAVLGGILTAVSPGERFEKPFKLVVSLFLLFVLLSPFTKLGRLMPDFMQGGWDGGGRSEEEFNEKLWEDTARATEKALGGNVWQTVKSQCGIEPARVTARVENRDDSLALAELTVVLERKDAALAPVVRELIKKSYGIDAQVILD